MEMRGSFGFLLLFGCVYFLRVVCGQVAFQLIGSTLSTEGYLSITAGDRSYSVCPYKWDLRNAKVLCRHLGFMNAKESIAKIYNNVKHLSEYWRVLYQCQGKEGSLSECKQGRLHRYRLDEHCSNGFSVWLSCQNQDQRPSTSSRAQEKLLFSDWRLSNWRYSRNQIIDEGNLEVSVDGTWAKVCGDGWTAAESHVACGQLGFPAATRNSTYPAAKGDYRYLLYTFSCSGTEHNLTSCIVHNRTSSGCHAGHVYLACQRARNNDGELLIPKEAETGLARLRAGHREFEGRVELFINGMWGTVNDKQWDIQDASVLCRQLGFGTAREALPAAQFGQGIGKVHWDSVNCTGFENSLFNCSAQPCSKHCKHLSDAGVKCHYPKPNLNPVRLVGGRNDMEGRVEIFYQNRWFGICGIDFDEKDGRVVCRELGLGFVREASGGYQFGVNYDKLMYEVKCSGNEKSIRQCPHIKRPIGRCVYYDMAYVRCMKEHPDLLLDLEALMSSISLSRIKLYDLTCSRDEGCLSSSAYQDLTSYSKKYTRSLLRFSAKILNKGTDAFRPAKRKSNWIWHSCHQHFHSMERFSDFDMIDFYGRKVAEGHKASFCLEDSSCEPGYQKVFNCTNKGEQGISVNCADNYKYTIDCQWVDITDLKDGNYTLLLHINPTELVGESDYTNNFAACEIDYHRGNIRVGHCSSDPCHVRSYGGTGYGLCCHFPFIFEGKHRYGCVPDVDGHTWCATTPNFDRDQKWGYCDLQKALAVERSQKNTFDDKL